MTTPAPLNLPSASERYLSVVIDGVSKWVACGEASAMDGAHWSNPSTPMSTAELHGLYAAGVHSANGGRTTDQLAAAVTAYYHHAPGRVSSYAAALAALRAGAVLQMSINYHNLPAELQRWDPAFAAEPEAWHGVAVGPIATGDTSADPLVWWRDPLSAGGTIGEWVYWSTVLVAALDPSMILVFGHNAWVTAPIPIPTPPPVTAPPPPQAPTPPPAPVPAPVSPPAPRKPLTYTVVRGDSLSRIGARFNVHWQDIYAANAAVIGGNPNLIRPGQVLVIPGHYV